MSTITALNVFVIKVPGTLLDDKKFFQYSDYDSENTPTDDQTKANAVAYARMRHVQRTLSELLVPQYIQYNYTTAGTAKSVPTDALISVGYSSIHPFIDSLKVAPALADQYTACADVIKALVLKALGAEFKELAEIQITAEREQYAGASAPKESFTDIRNIQVEIPAVVPAVTVLYKPI